MGGVLRGEMLGRGEGLVFLGVPGKWWGCV